MKQNNTKFIVVSGGVCSGLGKGIASASIGAILKTAGFSVFPVKLDPYLNVDPGTMSPYQHGEVYVTDDGTETDLDLGHYERFIDVSLSKLSNITSGQIYQALINKERHGDFLGKTIQIVPHITNHIKSYLKEAAEKAKVDFLLIEIGGTVGDIEGEPYLEAIRQLHQELGNDRVMFIHLTLLPYLKATEELKTKPTQASVKELLRHGIQPDMILARSDLPVGKDIMEKIALFCDVPKEAVIPALTVPSIYEVPVLFEKYHISKIIFNHFGIKNAKPNLAPWQNLVKKIHDGKQTIKIGLAGKYTENPDAYLSVVEALKSACYHVDVKLNLVWLDSEKLENKKSPEWRRLQALDGVVVPGGFGKRGIEGKILVARYARENNLPYLGLCLGSQIMIIEVARHLAGLNDANSEEFDPKSTNLVVHFLPGQSENRAKGGTLRLGSYPCLVKKGTKAWEAYKSEKIEERHRHRYEFNNEYKDKLEQVGVVISGLSPDGKLMEIVELKNHPFMVGSQFHPEFKSRPLRPHPLFREFIKAILEKLNK